MPGWEMALIDLLVVVFLGGGTWWLIREHQRKQHERNKN